MVAKVRRVGITPSSLWVDALSGIRPSAVKSLDYFYCELHQLKHQIWALSSFARRFEALIDSLNRAILFPWARLNGFPAVTHL